MFNSGRDEVNLWELAVAAAVADNRGAVGPYWEGLVDTSLMQTAEGPSDDRQGISGQKHVWRVESWAGSQSRNEKKVHRTRKKLR
jgi:hypothetical protein